MKRVYLGLGSNMGDREAQLTSALRKLDSTDLKLRRISGLYETEPVGFRDQPWFLNLVAEFDTELMPLQLLHRAQRVERELGRKRTIANGPRTVDVDVLFYGNSVIRCSELTVPHPRYHERRFVLAPLNELNPSLRDPVSGRSVAELLQAVTGQVVREAGRLSLDLPQQNVIIVGAGPTGLALGAELRRLGIPALILDRQAAGANTSRAAVIHARTLEVLEPLGIVPELLRNGVIVSTFRVRDRDRVLATVTFDDLDTPYPFTLMCPQDRTERILLSRLEALGGAVQRPCEVVAVQPGEQDVEVQFHQNQDTKTVHTKWLVGCDGSHSIVREKAAIPFGGGDYEESFVLADVTMQWPLGRDEVSLFFSDQGLVVVAPLPDDHFRIVATGTHSEAEPSLADFEQILQERGPHNGVVRIHRLVWSSRFHIRHRVAQALRQGRILLAGDAAHVHSPAGGQGMNTGIQDAVSMAAALAESLRTGDETALQAWEKNRLQVAHSVVDFTDRMTRVATTSSPVLQKLRNAALELLGGIPFVRHQIAEKLSEIDLRSN